MDRRALQRQLQIAEDLVQRMEENIAFQGRKRLQRWIEAAMTLGRQRFF